jgi:hypothetical protein
VRAEALQGLAGDDAKLDPTKTAIAKNDPAKSSAEQERPAPAGDAAEAPRSGLAQLARIGSGRN